MAYRLQVEYADRPCQRQAAHADLIWAKVTAHLEPEAIAAAKNADVVVAVVGITSELEGEEMPVNEPGFMGGDRTSIDLPKPEQDLLEASPRLASRWWWFS